jgi:hypothetical protein
MPRTAVCEQLSYPDVISRLSIDCSGVALVVALGLGRCCRGASRSGRGAGLRFDAAFLHLMSTDVRVGFGPTIDREVQR